MFIGRKYELEELQKAYQKNTFQFPVLYGRRRVGKTKILQEFIKNKPCIYFTAIESNGQKNLELLSAAIWNALMPDMISPPAFSSFDEALTQIVQLAQRRKIVFVIDEYPYLASADKSISSLLQSYIDNHFSNTDMMLILCGSSMSFMENQVLGYQSPLYGRRTAQFKILPFGYLESAEFVPSYSEYEKAVVYGVTGGIPKYLELIDDQLTLKENIIELFLKPNGYLYEEPYNLLKQELREPANYNAIIEAIATGSSKLNEISTKTHIETSALSLYLKTLISLGIIRKENAVTEESNRKKTLYSLADYMFCFWYRYIPNNMLLITTGDFENLYDDKIKPTLNDYMGHIFEEMSAQYVKALNKSNALPFKLQSLGRWWGNNPLYKREEEIDIVGVNEEQHAAVFCECKFRNEKTGADVLQALIEKSQIFSRYVTKYYILFSKEGFQEEIQSGKARTEILLVSLSDMFSRDTYNEKV